MTVGLYRGSLTEAGWVVTTVVRITVAAAPILSRVRETNRSRFAAPPFSAPECLLSFYYFVIRSASGWNGKGQKRGA